MDESITNQTSWRRRTLQAEGQAEVRQGGQDETRRDLTWTTKETTSLRCCTQTTLLQMQPIWPHCSEVPQNDHHYGRHVILLC